ncbi:MAG: hypothetical protein ACQEP1_06330 [Nanobdellota archaeon]
MGIEDEISEDLDDKSMKEDNVYSENAREDLVDGDEISAEEEGFMKGYDEDLDPEQKEEKEE